MEIYDFLILLIKFYKITKSKQMIQEKWNNLKLFKKS